MVKALVIKELRESLGIVALAAFAAVCALVSLTGVSLLPTSYSQESYAIPFVSDAFTTYLAYVIGALAIALGFKQSAWEFTHNTYHFLLHRPVRRPLVFWAKLAVGCVLILVLGATMILTYASWAAAPGATGVPFYWSMTGSSWQLLGGLVAVYLSAFLSGIRPARWLGTRLAPLLCGGVILGFAYNVFWWWVIPIAVIITGLGMLLGIFYYVQQRDY